MKSIYQRERRGGLDRRIEIRTIDNRDDANNRRKEPRGELSKLLDCDVLCCGMMRKASMVNISKGGAKFRAVYNLRFPEIAPGSIMHFDVATPFGAASRSANVVWGAKSNEYYTWGVSFIQHAKTGEDALDQVLDIHAS